jgi:hypothetical protein
VFAKDLVDYFSLFYQTLSKQGHLQMIKTRAYVNKLDEIAKKKDEDYQEYDMLRRQELNLQNVRSRVLLTEHTLIERAFPYIPDNDGSYESRIVFMTAIQGCKEHSQQKTYC